MYKKKKILDIEAVYTANAFKNDSGYYVGAGSETKEEVYLYDLVNEEGSPIPRQPGGMMSFIPIPGKPDLFVSIMGLFPPFIGKDAGIYLHSRMESNWESGMALPMPFAHRCETIRSDDKDFLIIATVSKDKKNASDWSLPGEIHAVDLENCEFKRWKPDLVDDSLTRNHGMVKTLINGQEKLYVSGEQGIFSILREDGVWKLEQIFDSEVSEMALIDLDGSGQADLVTIEPFHGNTLNIYQQKGSGWKKRFSDSLVFGHGLSAGMFKSEPSVVVGNRGESMALERFVVKDLKSGVVEREIIEEGAAPTQTQVFSFQSTDYILSANQNKNEVALYS